MNRRFSFNNMISVPYIGGLQLTDIALDHNLLTSLPDGWISGQYGLVSVFV